MSMNEAAMRAARAGLKAINDEADSEQECMAAAAHIAAAMLCGLPAEAREDAIYDFIADFRAAVGTMTGGDQAS